jgi:hypothetical protein
MTEQELILERREEYMEDLRHEQLMTSDYDYFIEYNNDLLDGLRKLIDTHSTFGWNMTTDEILKEVKEVL